MRKSILTALAVLAFLVVPSTAGAATVQATFGVSAHHRDLEGVLNYDNVARTVTLDVTQTDFAGQTITEEPTQAVLLLTAPNGAQRAFNLASVPASTLRLDDGSLLSPVTNLTAPSDGKAGIINKGPQTYNVQVRVSADRASIIEFEMFFTAAGFQIGT